MLFSLKALLPATVTLLRCMCYFYTEYTQVFVHWSVWIVVMTIMLVDHFLIDFFFYLVCDLSVTKKDSFNKSVYISF